MFNDKTILITGGTGSFGQLFIKTILERYEPRRLIIYSRMSETPTGLPWQCVASITWFMQQH